MIRWSVIASQLPGRTDNDVKNYWNTKLKKKLAKINSNSNADNNPINPFSSPPPPPAAAAPPLVTEAYRHSFSPLLVQGYSGISTNHNFGESDQFGASSNSDDHIVSLSDQDQATTGISYVSYFSGTGAGEDDGVLMDFGMGNLPYDVINGFWFQEKGSNNEVPPDSSSLDEFSYLNIKAQGLC